MRLRLFVALAIVVLALVPSAARAGGEANFFLGQKDVSDLDEKLDEYGVALTFGGDWPVAIAVDILRGDVSDRYSYAYYVPGYGTYTVNADFEAEVLELQLGVRKTFLDGKVQPYVGGGLAWADADVTFTGSVVGLPGSFSVSESESGVGFWANGGVMFRIGDRFNIGIDVRQSEVEAEFEDEDIEIGGTHYGVLFGFRWGE